MADGPGGGLPLGYNIHTAYAVLCLESRIVRIISTLVDNIKYKKIKLGILTYHFSTNVGSLLQSYALQKVLNELGYENEIINYQKYIVNKQSRYKRLKEIIQQKIGFVSICIWPVIFFMIKFYESIDNLIGINNLKLQTQKTLRRNFINIFSKFFYYCNEIIIVGIYYEKKFNLFRKKYLKIYPEKTINRKALTQSDINERYIKFIVGSDQVWNYNIKYDFTYLLDFIKDSSKKIAYAPSFGVSYVEKKYEEDYRSLLAQFKFLSVREKQGRDIIFNLTKRKCPVLLDPVMLLKKEEWQKISAGPVVTKDYVVFYSRWHSETMKSFTEKLALENDCEIISLEVKKYTPEEWVDLFLNAKYIVTNSFHGVAFSINFQKNFFIEYHQTSATNSRLQNIIDMFSLQDRIIRNGKNSNMLKDINYDVIKEKLETKREESIKYLQTAVKYEHEN